MYTYTQKSEMRIISVQRSTSLTVNFFCLNSLLWFVPYAIQSTEEKKRKSCLQTIVQFVNKRHLFESIESMETVWNSLSVSHIQSELTVFFSLIPLQIGYFHKSSHKKINIHFSKMYLCPRSHACISIQSCSLSFLYFSFSRLLFLLQHPLHHPFPSHIVSAEISSHIYVYLVFVV